MISIIYILIFIILVFLESLEGGSFDSMCSPDTNSNVRVDYWPPNYQMQLQDVCVWFVVLFVALGCFIVVHDSYLIDSERERLEFGGVEVRADCPDSYISMCDGPCLSDLWSQDSMLFDSEFAWSLVDVYVHAMGSCMCELLWFLCGSVLFYLSVVFFILAFVVWRGVFSSQDLFEQICYFESECDSTLSVFEFYINDVVLSETVLLSYIVYDEVRLDWWEWEEDGYWD